MARGYWVRLRIWCGAVARGIGVTLITQRPAVLNKDVLTQAEVLIALRMTGPRDVAAIDEWVRLHADEDEAKTLKESLPALPVGTAWVWSPGWLGVLQQIHVRKRETFDSSATPKPGQRRVEPTERAAIDLDVLREQLSAQVEAAEATDPAKLQTRVRELESQLAARPTEIEVQTKIERVEVPILAEGEVERLEAQAHDLLALAKDLGNLGVEILGKLNALHASPKAPTAAPEPLTPVPKKAAQNSVSQGDKTDANITNPQQRILNALATFEALGLREVARSNVAIWADQSPTRSGFTNNLGALRTAGYIEYPSAGRVALADQGRQSARVEVALSSRAQLHDAWCARLSGPQARIVRVLVDFYPNAHDRESLARDTEQSPTSSGYTNNLGALRSLGLVDYPRPGFVAATDLLFPNGLK